MWKCELAEARPESHRDTCRYGVDLTGQTCLIDATWHFKRATSGGINCGNVCRTHAMLARQAGAVVVQIAEASEWDIRRVKSGHTSQQWGLYTVLGLGPIGFIIAIAQSF
jgi:hypothetical protein